MRTLTTTAFEKITSRAGIVMAQYNPSGDWMFLCMDAAAERFARVVLETLGVDYYNASAQAETNFPSVCANR